VSCGSGMFLTSGSGSLSASPGLSRKFLFPLTMSVSYIAWTSPL
jgi:hypothetical protein